MWIIWIIQSFLGASWMVLTKKVLENKKIWNNWQTFISRFSHALILLFIFSVWFMGINYNIPKEHITLFNISLWFISTIWIYITYPLRRIAYANEKISVLQPFTMLFQVFPIIIGFIFITSERANIITFIMAILASIVVIWANIDFKNIKINKYSLMVLTSSIIKSIQIFAILYFLTFISPASIYFTESILIILFSSFLILVKSEFSEIKLISKKYLRLLLTSNVIVIISIMLSLTLYSTMWVIATSLISLLYLVFVYTLWYFFLKDIPSKKDISITFFVVLCVIIWILFKS